ncbi:MAG: PAS domain S-box protein, partial [Candidatus Cloacimonetes bacterium]|nr:PAS domain S-box protein [Candidatus Cloacimonadota bacterium]
MFNGIFISLAYNAALLLTLGIIFDSVTLRNYRSNWWAKVLSGISLGIISLVIMINPWEMAHGIVFDTRSILFCIVGMFFGIIPAFISASIAAAYRIYLGGNGVYMGVSVIVASVLWGYMWKRTHSRWKNPYGLMEFYSLGIVTHLTMLGLTILLPISDRAQVLYTIAFPVLLLYPLITVILGKLLVRRLELRQERTDLKRSIKQFRSLYESAPIAYQSMDDNGNYISVNTAWLNTMGYELDEVLGKNISEFLHPDHILLFQECFDNFKVVGHINNAEHLLIKKDGSPVLASFDGVVLAAENGNFLQAQCLLTDITQRKKAELILAQSEEKYRLLAETAQDIIIVHLIDGSVTYANPKAFSFFNVPVDELPSMNIFDFVSPKDHPILAAHALERQQGFMGSYLYQLELNNKSGIKMQVEISSSPIITNDKVT